MNPLTANPVIALDYARRVNAERVRQAEEYRRHAQLGKVPRESRRARPRRGLVAWRPRRRRFAATV